MAHYYLNEDNQSVGPMDLAAIRKLAEAGIVKPDVLIREAGSETWRPLSRRKETTVEAEAPKPPRTPPPAQRPQPAATSTQPAAGPAVTVSQDWFPIASLIAGIVALVCLGVPPLAVILGGAALTLGLLGYRSPEPKTRTFAIAGLSTGALALIVSAGIMLSGANGGTSRNPEAAAIERVLEQRDRIYRDAAKNFRGSTADAAQHFARELQRIDTRDCPTEFRVAHQDVVTAWGTSIPYLAADTPVTLVFEGVVGWLTDDFSGIGLSNQQAQLATQQLQAAHQSLHRIAVAHGARIPTR